MGLFEGKAVPGALQAELNARASVTANNAWFATRTTWVSVQSFCNQCGDYAQLNTFAKPSYQGGGYSGNRPNPVIEGIDVKAQGNLGTTRTATVKFLAFTEDQVNKLIACYGPPGMSVRVMFGWNKGAAGQNAPTPTGAALTNNQAICSLNEMIKNNPTFDGLQGMVGKYTVSFEKELMAWRFVLDITGASSAVMTRPVEDFTNQCYCERTSKNAQGQEETTNRGNSPLRAKITDWIERANSLTGISGVQGVQVINLAHPDRDAIGNSSAGIMSMLAGLIPFNTVDTDEAFMEFGLLEDLINKYSSSKIAGEPLMGKFDSSKLGELSYKKPGYSADPDICLFPGLDKGYGGLSGSCIGPNGGIDIRKILLNCIFVNKCIEDCGKACTIQDFMERILNGINQASAGIFELSILDTGTCGSKMPTMSVIDLHKAKVNKGYVIPVGPTKAVVRDIKLDLELPEAMRAQALYGGIRNNANSTPCEEKGFAKILADVKDTTIPVSKAEPPAADCPEDCESKEQHNSKNSIDDDYQAMVDEITDTSKETLRSRLVDTYNAGAENDICKNKIVPFKFAVTMDGVGGFGWGQMIDCDLIPSYVRQKFTYQVTAVEHSITYGDWTTTVNSVARYV